VMIFKLYFFTTEWGLAVILFISGI
jgi:hypothetical protein